MKNVRIVESVMADGSSTFNIEYKVLGLFWMGEFPYTRTFPDFKEANATAKNEYHTKNNIQEIEKRLNRNNT